MHFCSTKWEREKQKRSKEYNFMHLSQKKTVNMEQVWELKPENLHVNCFLLWWAMLLDMPAQLCTHDAMLQEASGCPSVTNYKTQKHKMLSFKHMWDKLQHFKQLEIC